MAKFVQPRGLRAAHAQMPTLMVNTINVENEGGIVMYSDGTVMRIKVDLQLKRLKVLAISQKGVEVFKLTAGRDRCTVHNCAMSQLQAAAYWNVAVEYCNDHFQGLSTSRSNHDTYMAFWAGVCMDHVGARASLASETAPVEASTL